ncbi:MAG: hypothetical protein WAV05_07795 [Anaerolineales bacterium]
MSNWRLWRHAFGLALIVLLLAGCGGAPAAQTDEEFADAAQGVCTTLKAELDPLDALGPIGVNTLAPWAEAYERASEALADLVITEVSAPQGTRLRSGLAELADSYDAFGEALDKAVAQNSDPEESYVVGGFLGDGTVILFPLSGRNLFERMEGSVQIETEKALVLNLLETETAVREAARSLGLEDCTLVAMFSNSTEK